MTSLSTLLQQQFGFEHFRDGQEQTIAQLLDGHSSLAIFPTGSGKSLCYQLTAINLPHLTLVVSPLLALMKDQLAFLHSKGIAAASIDSSLTYEQQQQIVSDVKAEKIKILMVSVERFKNERFRQFIESIAISMLVVDEAHCISEWGHNFRPDYLKLPQYRQALGIPLVLLLTATATSKVKLDMAKKFAIQEQHIIQTGFYRKNLDLNVIPVEEAGKNQLLLKLMAQQVGNGIVYVTLQQSAEQVASFLKQHGYQAVAYHAGLNDDVRQSIQKDFMNNNVPIIVATIAFGMGIDKANIRFVIHYDLPKSIENYSQEIGRAGRDNNLAKCYTLANLDGINTVENFTYADTPERAGIEFVLKNIAVEAHHEHWEVQLLSLSNASNIKQLPLKTLLVQLELLGVLAAKFSYFADFKFKFVTDKSRILALFDGERQQFLSHVFSSAKMKKIWGEPDFDQMLARFQTPRKRIVAALEYLAEHGHIILETKKATDVYSVNRSVLASQGLSEKLFNYFQVKEQAEIKRISQLVAFFESKTCLTANLSRYFDDLHSPMQCGHCSVCRNDIAILAYSRSQTPPPDVDIKAAIKQLSRHFKEKYTVNADGDRTEVILSTDTICRFLSGMSVPLFTRNKVRQLSYFGVCQHMRYQDIKQLILKCMKEYE